MSRVISASLSLGTLIISISLALLVVGFIPSIQNQSYTRTNLAEPETWQVCYNGVLSPQIGVRVSSNANATYKLYILCVDLSDIYNWIESRVKGSNVYNLTMFDQYLNAGSDQNTVIRQDERQDGGTIEFDCVPSQIIDVSIIITNPSHDRLYFNVTSTKFKSFGQASIRVFAETMLMIGIALTIPQTTKTLTTIRRRSSKTRANLS